jgi:hypothetical protein
MTPVKENPRNRAVIIAVSDADLHALKRKAADDGITVSSLGYEILKPLLDQLRAFYFGDSASGKTHITASIDGHNLLEGPQA